jgi:hypothetical protein
MRISIDKLTGFMIEANTHSTAETLIKNATAQGFQSVEVIEATEDEFRALVEAKKTPNQKTLESVAKIESTITPRRLREAVTTQAGHEWIAAQDAAIAALREQLVAGQP